jgi:PPK2 family polyphosphate:nucleotide phosphotransferase
MNKRSDRIDTLIRKTIVTPGKKIVLARDFDPGYVGETVTKKEARQLLRDGIKELAELQDKLYAQDSYSVLIILQAMDAAGKDGTIKHVMSGMNPQGCQVYSFKAPSAEELDHDFLWRCAKALPERGRIGIFNRSYYEEVLVVRVHPEFLDRQRLPASTRGKDIWRRRLEQINNFERYLVDNGTVVLKFFLNVSKEEQKKRFLDRINEPEKNWKFSANDVKERAHWDDYQSAYQEMLRATSTEWAPWYVIPADNKWFTRIAVGALIYRTLQKLGLRYPEISKGTRRELEQARLELTREK